MSKSADWDIERKESVQRLKDERADLTHQMISETDLHGEKMKGILAKIAIIDDQIALIDPSQV